MIKEMNLRVLPQQAASEQDLKVYIGKNLAVDVSAIHAVRVLKRSIDARQRTILVNLSVRVYINELPDDDGYQRIE